MDTGQAASAQGGSEPGALDGMDLDIYGFWAECRRDQPVVEVDGATMGRPTWMVTRYDDVESVLRDPDRFSSRINNETMGPVMGALILGMDGDEHRRYRSLVAQAFRPSALARWDEELIAPTITALLDAVAPLGRADLVADVTSRYPVQVIAGVLGIPLEDFEQFQKWALAISQGPQDYSSSVPASQEMTAYLEPIVAARRANPTDDLVSDIVTAEVDGARLSDELVYGFLRLLLPAGAETTFRVMGSTLFALLTHPVVMARALSDEGVIVRVIEEVLRWETSVTMVNREALEPVEIAGAQVPKGASLICCTGSANHDESRYEDPERFDPDRDPKPHIAFGTGRHQCLGMHLARLELRVGVSAVLDRLPNLRLDPDAQPPRIEGIPFRSPTSLPVVFDPT
ncbi:MAG: cytochrome P450 [Acidimicrobiales bacterium]